MPPDSGSGVYFRGETTPRPALAAEQAPLTPEQEGEDDRLEDPGVRSGIVLGVAAGLLAFVAAALGVLLVFFSSQVGGETSVPARAFPLPRLEVDIDPPALPARRPGPAESVRPVAPEVSPEAAQQAMQMIVAKGAHAYDPLPTGGGT